MRPYLVAALLVALDQTTKVMVKGFSLFGWNHQGMYLGESRPIIDDAVLLTFVENPGMAFGIEWGSGKMVLTILTLAIAGFLSWYVYRMRDAGVMVRTSLTLILAGAVGNLIDRMFYGVLYGEGPLFEGKVVDFIQVNIPDVSLFGTVHTHFPVFNVADSCVSIGVVLLILFGSALTTDRPVEEPGA